MLTASVLQWKVMKDNYNNNYNDNNNIIIIIIIIIIRLSLLLLLLFLLSLCSIHLLVKPYIIFLYINDLRIFMIEWKMNKQTISKFLVQDYGRVCCRMQIGTSAIKLLRNIIDIYDSTVYLASNSILMLLYNGFKNPCNLIG